MRKMFRTLALLTVLLLKPVVSGGVMELGGGLSFPMGQGSEDFNIGFDGSTKFFGQVSEIVSLGVALQFNRWGYDEDKLPSRAAYDVDVSVHYIQITPAVRITNSNTHMPVKIFQEFGGGLFLGNANIDVTIGSENIQKSESKNDLGIYIGGGMMVPINEKADFIMAPYFTIVFSGGDATKYFDVKVGFGYNF